MIPDPAYPEVLYVCRNLRPLSAEEMALFNDNVEPEGLARAFHSVPGFKWVGYHEGVPAAILGAYPIHEGVWGLFGFGTDGYAEIMREATKFARREMMETVKATGARRAQAYSPAHHEETHRWLRFLGAREEATLEAYGRGGADVKVFAWVRRDG